MKVQQHPLLGIITSVDGAEENAQERTAWGRLAGACEVALNDLHPHHPQRGEFVAMWSECRQAAGLLSQPAVAQTA